ncbi:hypothetical protein VPH35_110721 [Triticum aestivum]|uniref:Autophagy-related protein n=1 Tax=Triticum aestivum TaxID=4565 RepID=A0A3B6PL31_WHEAT|nr:uncharacterized protein LOC123134100 [Triticum aestivum]
MAKTCFKTEHPLERRQAESARIREKYADRIPVIVEKADKSDLPKIDKRYLVPNEMLNPPVRDPSRLNERSSTMAGAPFCCCGLKPAPPSFLLCHGSSRLPHKHGMSPRPTSTRPLSPVRPCHCLCYPMAAHCPEPRHGRASPPLAGPPPSTSSAWLVRLCLGHRPQPCLAYRASPRHRLPGRPAPACRRLTPLVLL